MKAYWFISVAMLIALITLMALNHAGPSDGFPYWGSLFAIWWNITALSYQYVKLFKSI